VVEVTVEINAATAALPAKFPSRALITGCTPTARPSTTAIPSSITSIRRTLFSGAHSNAANPGDCALLILPEVRGESQANHCLAHCAGFTNWLRSNPRGSRTPFPLI